MQTRRPDYHITSEQTISHDVKQAIIHACKHIVNMVQEYEGELNFAMDMWTS